MYIWKTIPNTEKVLRTKPFHYGTSSALDKNFVLAMVTVVKSVIGGLIKEYSVLLADTTVRILLERAIGWQNNGINIEKTGHRLISFWEMVVFLIMIVVLHQASVSISPGLRINGTIFKSRSGNYFSNSWSHGDEIDDARRAWALPLRKKVVKNKS